MFAQGKFPHHRQRHALAHPEEAAQEHHYRDGAQDTHAELITLRSVALTQNIHHPRQADGDKESRHAAQHKAPGLAGDHLIVAGGHGVDQRTVRHVDGGIADGEQQIGAERPGNFYAHAGVRDGKREYANNANGNRNPQLPGAKAPPATLGTVGQHAHYRVGNGVKYAQGNKQCTNQCGH